jgi:metal-sulfur cluster biosynthetic enzyme
MTIWMEDASQVPAQLGPDDLLSPDDGLLNRRWATAEQLLEALKDVVDPELGVNIVDLGLVYGVDIDADGLVTVDLTLTSPACPLTDQLEMDIQYLLSALAREVVINWVWMPPWNFDMISDDGREQLRAIGFNV